MAKRVWHIVERFLPQALRIPKCSEKNVWNPNWVWWMRWCDRRRIREGEKKREKALTHKNRPNACYRSGFIFLNSNDRGHETTDCWLMSVWHSVSLFGCVESAHQFATSCAPCQCWAHLTGGEDLSVSRRCFMLECHMLDVYCGNKSRCIQMGLACMNCV